MRRNSISFRFFVVLAILSMEVTLLSPFGISNAHAGEDWKIDQATGVSMKLERAQGSLSDGGKWMEDRLRLLLNLSEMHVIERSTDLRNWTPVGSVYGMGQELVVPMTRRELGPDLVDSSAPIDWVEPSYPEPSWRGHVRVAGISGGGVVATWKSLEDEAETVQVVYPTMDYGSGDDGLLIYAWGALGEWGEVLVSWGGVTLASNPGATALPHGRDAELKNRLDAELAAWITSWADRDPVP